jgi:hypothetical protein
MPWRILDNDAILTAISAVKSTSINNGGTVLPAATSLYDSLTSILQPHVQVSLSTTPVSDTYYTLLDTTLNCELISVELNATWAVTQPTNLRIRATVDGNTIIFTVASPVSGTAYFISHIFDVFTAQPLSTTENDIAAFKGLILASGRSVKLEAALTWAITQPTGLGGNVQYRIR